MISVRRVGWVRPLLFVLFLVALCSAELSARESEGGTAARGADLALLGAGIALVQMLFIVGLVISVRRARQLRRRVEDEFAFVDSLMKNLPVPVFFKDLEGRYQRVNRAFAERVIGQPEREILGGRLDDIEAYGSQDARDIHTYHDRLCASSLSPVAYSAYTPFADGRRHSVSISKAPVFDEDGTLRGILGSILDLSDTQLAQARVRRLEESQQVLLDSLPVQVWFLTPQFTYRLANRSHRTFARIDGPKLEHLTVAKTLPDPAGTELAHAVKQVARTGVPSDILVETRTRDDQRAYLEVSIAPELNRGGSLSGLVCIASDTTAQVELQRQRDELATALEQTPVSVMITDLGGRISYVNRGCEAMTGYSEGELIGQAVEILSSGEHPSEVYRDMWDTILTRSSWKGQFHNRRKDGSLYWERATITPVFGEDDEAIEYIKVAEDISRLVEARTALENELSRSNSLLREVFHRSKNNLQVLDSAVYLRGMREHDLGPAGRRFVREIRALIQVIASAHDALDIWGDPDRVPLHAYLKSVCSTSAATLELELSGSFAEAAMHIERALPAGIALNDLLTELKRSMDPMLPLRVTGGRDAGEYKISVQPVDNGISEQSSREGSGVLADAVVVHQLDGTLERHAEGFCFRFPLAIPNSGV